MLRVLSIEVLPSPKFHSQVTAAPGVVTDVLVNVIVSLAHAFNGEAEKFTIGSDTGQYSTGNT